MKPEHLSKLAFFLSAAALAGCAAMALTPQVFSRILTLTVTLAVIVVLALLWVNVRSSAPAVVRERKWLVLILFFALCNIGIIFGERLLNIDQSNISAAYPFAVLFIPLLVAVIAALRERARFKRQERF